MEVLTQKILASHYSAKMCICGPVSHNAAHSLLLCERDNYRLLKLQALHYQPHVSFSLRERAIKTSLRMQNHHLACVVLNHVSTQNCNALPHCPKKFFRMQIGKAASPNTRLYNACTGLQTRERLPSSSVNAAKK